MKSRCISCKVWRHTTV